MYLEYFKFTLIIFISVFLFMLVDALMVISQYF